MEMKTPVTRTPCTLLQQKINCIFQKFKCSYRLETILRCSKVHQDRCTQLQQLCNNVDLDENTHQNFIKTFTIADKSSNNIGCILLGDKLNIARLHTPPLE